MIQISLLKKRKKALFLLALSLIFGSLLVFYVLPSFNKPYTIAVVHISQAHTASLHPTRLRAALSLAWDDYWAERKPNQKIQLKHYTYEGDGPILSEIINALEEDRVIALIGDFTSSTTKELATIANHLRVPHLSPIATDETIIEEQPWTFSPRTRLKHESEAIIGIIQDELLCSNLILLATDIAGFMNRYQDFKERALGLGLEILLDIEIDSRMEDFGAIINEIQEIPSATPIVSFISSNQTVDFYQQLSIQGLGHPRISSAAVINQEIVGYLGEAGEGVYSAIVSFFLVAEEEKKSRDFSANYMEFLGTGRVDNTAISIYESLWALLEVIEEVGVDPEKIREGLLAYRGRPLTGYVSFDTSGLLAENNHLVAQIRDGAISRGR